MKHRKLYFSAVLILMVLICFPSCENIFEAENENLGTIDRVYQSPALPKVCCSQLTSNCLRMV